MTVMTIQSATRLSGAVLGAAVLFAVSANSWAQETIDFEGLAEGSIVSQVFGDGGSGPIMVEGVNPSLAGNTAMIFDSSCPPGGVPADCSGGDPDLGTPNTDFGGPGLDQDGNAATGGNAGSPFQNDTALGNVLIVSEDLNTSDPDDADVAGSTLSFGFSALGSVTVQAVTIIDVEADEPTAVVTLFDGGGGTLGVFPLPNVGDNGVATDSLSPTSGVVRMEILLNGSGAIDNILFIPDAPNIEIVKEVSVDGGATFFDANDPASAPSTDVGSGALYRLTVTNTGAVDLTNVLINDSTLGIVNFLVGNLAVGQTVVLSSGEIPQLDQPGLCASPGNVSNVADVSGDPPAGNPVTDSDPANVLCVDVPTPPRRGGPQEPYIATVGDDTSIPIFYTSPKHRQFLHPNTDPAYFPEGFAAQFNADDPEVCDATGVAATNVNVLTPHNNEGFYNWTVVLPKKPRGNLNIVIQCGILKPESEQFLGVEAIERCAGETGERIGPGFCTRKLDVPGRNPVRPDWIPRITATASPGPFNSFQTFNLTSFRNPGPYSFVGNDDGSLRNDTSKEALNGSNRSKVVLKACMDKTIFVKIPVTGQVNALGQTEQDLEAGDIVRVNMAVPRGHSMDVYCHAQSLRVQGLGDGATLLP